MTAPDPNSIIYAILVLLALLVLVALLRSGKR